MGTFGSASLRQLIETEIARVRGEDPGGYVTYAIRDTSTGDPLGHDQGPPVYIGQSKEWGKRTKRRLSYAEKRANRLDNVDRFIVELWRKGFVPHFQFLERVETRLASLVSETNWCRHFNNQGYKLRNQWKEHKETGPPITRFDVPHDRIWPFTIEEALEDNITVALECRRCDLYLPPLPLAQFVEGLEPRPRHLREIKENGELKCGGCGASGGHYVKLRLL